MELGQLAAVAGILGFLVFLGYMLASKKPTGGIPLPPGGVVAPPLQKLPAPLFAGFLLPYAVDEGQRIPIAAWPTKPIGSSDGPCAVQRGLVDNQTGPYKMKFEAFRKSDARRVPVYRGDTGPRCDGEWIDPGEVVIYANGMRPYAAIGSGYPCGFIPLGDPDAAPRACGDTVAGLPPSAVTQVATDAMVIHFQAQNRDGVLTPVWEQTIPVVPSHCEK